MHVRQTHTQARTRFKQHDCAGHVANLLERAAALPPLRRQKAAEEETLCRYACDDKGGKHG